MIFDYPVLGTSISGSTIINLGGCTLDAKNRPFCFVVDQGSLLYSGGHHRVDTRS
ncbi:MAG: hypothetical protein HOC47_08325 [Candidatus Marinimicrobia bacterium]|nr:hypothetical protein [Candidatus Neomarinimicrobiota bacterium]MBT3997402.1 hypothetical protein [Candidatus Neomarinimicrobiota bacterium]MBT4570549.1 hypothetical protein [Candidatus Neomarinimicrobiota bacterium]MBT4795317.1 hypothetical protein [Candidatus Neomarinimicrobiota bacterium]MBT5339197.1 hypothetical protein [Candidatus Neomarinimicrobiota bacterium]